MIKPSWPRYVRRAMESRMDPAPGVLERIAVEIERRAGEVMRGRASGVWEAPMRGSRPPARDAGAYAWHSDAGDGVDVWCLADDGAARALLEVVLGGPGAPEPTSLERSIIRETIERILSASGRSWEERSPAKAPAAPGWLCRITIVPPRGLEAALLLYAPSVEEPPAPTQADRVNLREVPITLHASLPSIGVRVEAIAAWERGALVSLSCRPDIGVTLHAGGVRVANGRLGSAGSRRAVLVEPSMGESPR